MRNSTPSEQEDVDNSNDMIAILDNRYFEESETELKLLGSEPEEK